MDASSVVVLEPGCKGCAALVVACEDLPVGPFDLQCAVEAFDFAVLPGAMLVGTLMADTRQFQNGTKQARCQA